MKKSVTSVTFEKNWYLLIRECAKRREKETNIDHSQNFFENAYCQTKKKSVTTKNQ